MAARGKKSGGFICRAGERSCKFQVGLKLHCLRIASDPNGTTGHDISEHYKFSENL